MDVMAAAASRRRPWRWRMHAPARTLFDQALLPRRDSQPPTATDASYGCVDWYCYEHAADKSAIAALVTRTLASPATVRVASLPIEATG
jgi:hypothetical protein